MSGAREDAEARAFHVRGCEGAAVGAWARGVASGSVGETDVAHALVARAAEKGVSLSTAESCTAGLIASAVADVPGASEVLLGGAVTYTDRIKRQVLGVSEETLALHTAVSAACARELAEGSRKLYGSDVAVSATGYAGPGGGTPMEPVGTVYVGAASARGVYAWRLSVPGDRAEVRSAAAAFALASALDLVDSL